MTMHAIDRQTGKVSAAAAGLDAVHASLHNARDNTDSKN